MINLSILQQSYQLLRSFDKKKAKIIIGFSLAIAVIIIVTLMLTLFVDIRKYHSSTAPRNNIEANIVAGSLELVYSLIWGSHEIWGKGGGDTLVLL